MQRRTLLAGLGTVGVAGLAGCLALAGMDQHEASPAGVDAETRGETEYQQTGIDDVVVERDVGVGPLSEEISVTNYVTEHEKSVDLGPLGEARAAMFFVLSTPKIDLLGRTLNPVEDMSAAELIDLLESNYDQISNVEADEESSVEILGQSTSQTRFTADAVFDGESVDVYLHVSEAVEAGEDLVVTIGVYPRQLSSQERPNVLDLMEAVTEDADEEATSNGNESSDDQNESGGVLGITG